jgi:hypothetical protein
MPPLLLVSSIPTASMKGRLLLRLLCSQRVLCVSMAESGHFAQDRGNNTLHNTLSVNERESDVTVCEAP